VSSALNPTSIQLKIFVDNPAKDLVNEILHWPVGGFNVDLTKLLLPGGAQTTWWDVKEAYSAHDSLQTSHSLTTSFCSRSLHTAKLFCSVLRIALAFDTAQVLPTATNVTTNPDCRSFILGHLYTCADDDTSVASQTIVFTFKTLFNRKCHLKLSQIKVQKQDYKGTPDRSKFCSTHLDEDISSSHIAYEKCVDFQVTFFL